MSQPSWIGYTIGGRYKIDSLLGQGGMSSVYKAHDPNLRRAVAVKLIHPHLSSNAEFVRRFEEEAAAVAQLRHPHIIQVFDFNHDNNIYYMVLEFLEGETLQDRLKRQREQDQLMPMEDVIKIGAGLADAIEYAHRRGMIHRDIKPANVMLDENCHATLMDFGIAKIIGGEQHTATGTVVGTALYMAPEQAMGQRPSKQSDIYSLGVTLFEMVGGRPPFEGDSAMSVMMMHINDPVPDLSQINPATPHALKAVIDKALSKDPADRYASAGDVAAALRGVDLRAPATRETKSAPKPAPAEATYIEPAPPPVERTWQEAPPPPRTGGMPLPPPVSGTGGYAQPPAAEPRQTRGRRGSSMALIGGGIGLLALLVICGVGGLLLVRPLLSGGGLTGGNDNNSPPTSATTQEVAVLPTGEAQTQEVVVTEEALPATEAVPTETAVPTEEPTPTVPSEPYVRINSITIEGSQYVVEYETFGYTEVLPGDHVHFFFDTVAPANAGVPGSGPWYLYGGPRPFTGYYLGDKPAAATQMCALVANANHSIIMASGNCVDLPTP